MKKDAIILLVDDSEDDVAFMKHAFRKAGFTGVRIVQSGGEAIDYLAARGEFSQRELHPVPNLVILDLSLPGGSGLEVLKWIRSRERLRRLPVVAMTAAVAPRVVNQAYDEGINSFLIKPGRLEDLVAMMESFLDYWLVHTRYPDLEAPSAGVTE